MRIGKTDYAHGLFLAPMAGVTDRAFRALCKRRGAEGLTTEMVSAKALLYGSKNTAYLCQIDEEERPCALQLFGHVPEEMGRAAVLVMKYRPCAIDLNMGCPAPKIVRGGDGSALLRDPALCGAIVKAVREALDAAGFPDVPVTVKLRSGFDAEHLTAVEVAKRCEDAGAACLTVHGRTREQMYAPSVDLSVIAGVKRAVTVPVVGNGDVTDEESAARMLSETGCDGLMIGRGALGEPYLFGRIAYFLEHGQKAPDATDAERYADVCFHMERLIAEKGEAVGTREARKHIAWYIKGRPGAASLRDEAFRAETKDDVMRVVEKAFLRNKPVQSAGNDK